AQPLSKRPLRLLSRISQISENVIVGLSTDEFNEVKGKKSTIPFHDRLEILQSLKFVNLVIPEVNWAQKEYDINNLNVDLFVMGDDWEFKFDHLKTICDVLYLPRTELISTTIIRESMRTR
ncbi:glycerol-3-phosphate cytidylyltransferase, partial [Sphingobium yanoikuyae]|uniref:glycerol-3-phosphate cytidylyltransferase n=1 Tax=Sphingobium yanoikuyae TaxID=13690 RepID=UPI0019132FCA